MPFDFVNTVDFVNVSDFHFNFTELLRAAPVPYQFVD
jgi:hypothetical protein